MIYKDIVATIGTYERDGKKQYVTRKVGVLMETDKGPRIKLDASFNPAGCPCGEDGGVWLALFDPKPREQQKPHQQAGRNQYQPAAPKIDNFDDDIKF